MPDVTWHPVDETPPVEEGQYLVCYGYEGLLTFAVAEAWFEEGGIVWCRLGTLVEVEGVTHWAHIVYPEPQEEA